MVTHFDDSLPVLAREVEAHLGREILETGVALRDASGRLAFFANVALGPEQADRASGALSAALGAFSRGDRVLADLYSPGTARVLEDPSVCVIQVGERAVRYLDRRVVGADWAHSPAPEASEPPRFVFSSLKGGVGRSTALSVVAAEQARNGRNVLVVDMDLEAPGIGSMLLDLERRPAYGALDYLAESGLGNIGQGELADFVGTSALTSGAGLVDVMPVCGSTSQKHPANFLAKLSRAMVEDIGADGRTIPLRDKIREMIERIASRRSYDLILVDARAGLAELAAGPLLGLGATVFLFGTAQKQTIEGYRFLLAHLATLPRRQDDSPWQQLRVVHAKASLSGEASAAFTEDMWEIFAEFVYEELDGLEGFNFDVDDPEAPHYPIPILFDSRFAEWDPIRRPTELTKSFYDATFGTFTAVLDRMMSPR